VQFSPQMLGDNPFAALTTIVAPAVLTNACSVLSLGTGNRIARVVDQSKRLQAMLAEAEGEERTRTADELRRLTTRSKMLLRAMRLFYGSLGCFAGAALLAVVGASFAAYGATTAFKTVAGVGFLVGALGVVGLSSGCVLLVREVRMALEQTEENARRALAGL